MTIDLNKSYKPEENNINDIIKAVDTLNKSGWLKSHDDEIRDEGELIAINKIINKIFDNKYKVIKNDEF